jgi:hypothetical protein
VTGGHILVKSVDGSNAGHLTVLLVHVVGAGARVVADPDTEVLDLLGALLVDLEYVSLLLFRSLTGAGVVRIERDGWHAPG